MHVAQIELFKDVEIEIGEIMDRIEPLGLVRAAEAWMLWHEHVIALRQHFHEWPHARSAVRAVQVQELAPFPAALERDAGAAHVHAFKLKGHQSTLIFASSTTRRHLS
jgi:hypothetical protein